ncbi:arylamine N-acetyltransferase [Breoghania sp. L-A4]|uniref:arylamine N-acetyltransferase family protein n=1 Tax=Breoghania sp. L-A4 TaxID=2304600 RepID=UPI0013C2A667|nr:arylamine N-acetyltransferase [Breoghania sp. L-A4]
MTFDIDCYLDRLGIAAPATTAAGLAILQERQLCSISFEDIDPLTGVVPALDPEALSDKLLKGGRGGYCFELNGLFRLALEALGFSVAPVLARVYRDGGEPGPRAHLAFIVTIEGLEWLADVGFGGPGARWPIPVALGRIERQMGQAYRLINDMETGETVLQREEYDGWSSLYGFDRAPVPPCDVEAANFLCARWDKMPFSTNLTINRLTPGGRVSAFNTSVTEVCGDVVSKRQITDAKDLARLLADAFALTIEPATLAVIVRRLGLVDDVNALPQTGVPAA